MVLLQRKLSFSKDPEGVQHFPGGIQLFSGGIQMLISIETHMTCYFPGGGGGGPDSLSPLWIRTCLLCLKQLSYPVVKLSI